MLLAVLYLLQTFLPHDVAEEPHLTFFYRFKQRSLLDRLSDYLYICLVLCPWYPLHSSCEPNFYSFDVFGEFGVQSPGFTTEKQNLPDVAFEYSLACFERFVNKVNSAFRKGLSIIKFVESPGPNPISCHPKPLLSHAIST